MSVSVSNSHSSKDVDLEFPPLCQKGKAPTWLDDEQEVLIQYYGEEITNTPQPPNRKYRPFTLYYNIAKKLNSIGYTRTPVQVRNKIKALRQSYYNAWRGTKADRKNCFMYSELDRFFSDSCVLQNSRDKRSQTEDGSDSSTGGEKIHTPPAKKRRTLPDPVFADVDSIDACDDFGEASEVKKPLITTTTRIDRVCTDGSNSFELIEFFRDELEKTRRHQLEITKTFTNAMTEQFEKFSNLISNLTLQMFEQSKHRTNSVNQQQSESGCGENPEDNNS